MNNQVTIAQLPLHGKDGGVGDPVQKPQTHRNVPTHKPP